MKKYLLLILVTLNMAVGATTLEEFIPYNMYNNPREEIKNYYDFAFEHRIPTAGITTLDEMHVLDRGMKKLFRIYKEVINDHIFYHAFYITRGYGLSVVGDPYFKEEITRDNLSSAARIIPWVENLYELLDNEPEYGMIGENPYPMIYQRLYLEIDEELKFIDEAEYYLSFDRPGPTTIGWTLETLQPWALDEEYGYWFVHYETNEAHGMLYDTIYTHEAHKAKRVYLNERGEDIGHIDIEASRPLIDNKYPFKYTIQNAFDQNPATSYVENTEDDLMDIEFSRNGVDGDLTKSIMINGYSSSEKFYYANNRVKTLKTFFYEFYHIGTTFLWNDKRYTYQGKSNESFIEGNQHGNDGHNFFFNIKDDYKQITHFPGVFMSIHVTDIYSGSEYNDTCIAELDYCISGKWLFGGSYE